jgi:hypothetical protein
MFFFKGTHIFLRYFTIHIILYFNPYEKQAYNEVRINPRVQSLFKQCIFEENFKPKQRFYYSKLT